MAAPRVVIVDDHTLMTEALRRLLEPDCEVVGTYDDPRAFLREVGRLRPDVAVLDISMPTLNGLDAARELRRVLPSVRIIILTMNEDADVAAEAFRAGASAYLLNRSAASELKAAVTDVMNQRYYITPLLTRDLVGSFVQPHEVRRPIYQLTPRQREVLQLLAEGHSMKQAAAILNVSPRTVAFHKYRMMEHLRVQSTAALLHFAVREGLI
jgi:DNA-binding NarL/FixJ family response regulator